MRNDDEIPEGVSDERLQKRSERDVIKTFGSLIAACIAAGGIVLGGLEYKQRNEMIQARETLEMVDVWDQDGAREAYRSLASAVVSGLDGISSTDLATANESRAAYNNLRRSLSREILQDPDNAKDFDDVVYFFTRLSLCVEAELCDVTSANVFFRDTLNSFLDVFRTHITTQQESAPGYGQALFDLQSAFALE